MTAEQVRAAIDRACSLNNPRLSEVDWDAVARALDSGPRTNAATLRITDVPAPALDDEGCGA